MDTSGLEPFAANGSIQYRATELTTRVLRRADVVLLMLDGRCVDMGVGMVCMGWWWV